MKAKIVYSISLFAILLASCGSKGNKGVSNIFSGSYYDKDAFIEKTKIYFPAADSTDSMYSINCLSNLHTILCKTYQLNSYEPLWISGKGFRAAATSLWVEIDSLQKEGISIAPKERERLQYIIDQIKTDKEYSIDTLVAWDTSLTSIYLSVAHDLLMGKDFSKRDTQWFVENDSTFYAPEYLVSHFEDEDNFPSFDTFRSLLPEYKLALHEIEFWDNLSKDNAYLSLKKSINASSPDSILLQLFTYECKDVSSEPIDSISSKANSIRLFQKFYGLKPTSKLDDETLKQLGIQPQQYIAQLQTNLERLRAMPRQFGSEYVFVNIPLMELNYVRDKNVQFNSRVIVGRINNPTPSISSPMTNIVFNPPWGVPTSILSKEIAPGVARAGAGYLRRKGLRAIDSRGRDVTASVNAGNIRRYAITQPPGARNALGEIKFNMPNKESIYIHDTPNRWLFANSNRALSHGCVRTDNPKLFAETILGTNNYPLSTIDSIINRRQTKSQELERKIPVFITYLTITPDTNGKRLRYLKDIYGRDNKMKVQPKSVAANL